MACVGVDGGRVSVDIDGGGEEEGALDSGRGEGFGDGGMIGSWGFRPWGKSEMVGVGGELRRKVTAIFWMKS